MPQVNKRDNLFPGLVLPRKEELGTLWITTLGLYSHHFIFFVTYEWAN